MDVTAIVCYMDKAVTGKVAEFFGKYPLKKYAKGQILIHGGDEPEHIYYLLSGRVRQYDISYRGDEIALNIFQPPAFFPMSWAVNRAPNRYFFETLTDVELHQAPPDQVVDFIKSESDVMFDLLRRVYNGTDGMLLRLAHLMRGDAKSHLMLELMIEQHRFGEARRDGTYFIPVNENDLATRTGLSRETVSRQMHKLKAAGLVELSRGGVVLKDIKSLKKQVTTSL